MVANVPKVKHAIVQSLQKLQTAQTWYSTEMLHVTPSMLHVTSFMLRVPPFMLHVTPSMLHVTPSMLRVPPFMLQWIDGSSYSYRNRHVTSGSMRTDVQYWRGYRGFHRYMTWYETPINTSKNVITDNTSVSTHIISLYTTINLLFFLLQMYYRNSRYASIVEK